MFQFFDKKEFCPCETVQLLFDNLSLILNCRDLILQTPDYARIEIKGSGFGGLYFPNKVFLLSDLIVLWHETAEWHFDDNYCYYAVGSPLSGNNVSYFWNRKKGFFSLKTTPFVPKIRKAVFLMQRKNLDEKTHAIELSFPDRKTSALSLKELIARLQTESASV